MREKRGEPTKQKGENYEFQSQDEISHADCYHVMRIVRKFCTGKSGDRDFRDGSLVCNGTL